MIEIDGSYLEAGGQILRTAVALSAVTKKPCKVFNIRKGRPKPGLKNQHLRAIEAIAKITGEKIKGNEIGSEEIEFYPGKVKGGKFKIDVGTAGSVSLILQAILPAIVTSGENFEIEMIGGTNVKWSPSIEYIQHVFCSFLDRMGVDARVDTCKYGFYPKGGGRIKARISSTSELNPLEITERGNLKRIDIWSISSEELKGREVAERQVGGFENIFEGKHKHILYPKTLSTGTFIHAHIHYENTKLGADMLGEKRIKAEDVGKKCAKILKKEMDSGACLDRWMADQILPYMALAGRGKFTVSQVTNHCKTNIWAIEKFLPVKFEIKGKTISCKSI